MSAATTGGPGAPSRLAIHPDLDRALRTLLPEATGWVRANAPRAGSEPLLLLMGSCAVGEASGVPLSGRLLPLSDLDLGLFLDRGPSSSEAAALRRALAERLAPTVARLGLVRDPVDLGIYDLEFARRMPPTLELLEAARRPVALSGDPAPLIGPAGDAPRAFEGARLALNRLAEALAPDPPPGDDGVAGPRIGGWGPYGEEAAAWPPAANPELWQAAHRASKLPIDLHKAAQAVAGRLVASIEERAALLKAPAEGDAAADGELASLLGDWYRWRLDPCWPPPALPTAPLVGLVRQVLDGAAGAAGQTGFDPSSPTAWRALLASEGGPERERIRRWQRMLTARPAGMGPGRALRLALAWLPRGAWPRSLALVTFAAAWLEQKAGRGGESDLGRARSMVHWANAAGA